MSTVNIKADIIDGGNTNWLTNFIKFTFKIINNGSNEKNIIRISILDKYFNISTSLKKEDYKDGEEIYLYFIKITEDITNTYNNLDFCFFYKEITEKTIDISIEKNQTKISITLNNISCELDNLSIFEFINFVLMQISNDTMLNNFENFENFIQNLINISNECINYELKQCISFRILPKYNYLKSKKIYK